MNLKKKDKIRNAGMARNSFVTKRAETKVSALADLFKVAAGERWVQTESGVLQRKLFFSGFHYLDSLQLVYNWENRFMSVNYNLQMISAFPTDNNRFEETNDCLFTLNCTQNGFRGKRNYSWKCSQWKEDESKLNAYIERLNNPFILDRLDALDIMEMEIRHKGSWDYWRVSCESMIGSATWILIPPVLSMITPKPEECFKFLELYELLGDALVNNKI
jgi:hypothetical protein